ncbi:MAG: cytochrome P450 [Myxococcales bacterium]|nr:cytochrome P450 [Myxococcales bacterium]
MKDRSPPHPRRTPRLVSNTVSNADEVSRWILDRAGIAYVDERHAPGLHIKPANRAAGRSEGIANNPVLLLADGLAYAKDGVFRYVEERCAPALRLLPDDAERRRDATELYERFLSGLWRPVGRLVYKHLLPHRRYTVPLVTRGVPWDEALTFRLFYGCMARSIADGLELERFAEDELVAQIDAECCEVERRLGDGRPFLTGDTLTIADLVFAVVVAPLTLPPEFRGSVARSLEELPESLHGHVERMRGRVAGEFALRLFREHRPPLYDQDALPPEEGLFRRMWLRIRRFVLSPWLVTRGMWLVQRWMPSFRLSNTVYINRHKSVAEVLHRDEDFTIAQINGERMERLYVPFFLGMDRSPQRDRELALMRGVVRAGDLERIRGFVRAQAGALLGAQMRFGRVDVPATIAEPVMIRVIEDYFGVAAAREHEARRWLRAYFYDLFLNLNDDQDVRASALAAAGALKVVIEETISGHRRALARGEPLADNLLSRLLALQIADPEGWPDDDAIRRNITGMIIGALSTTCEATVLALDELLRRPRELAAASAAAIAGDLEAVRGYVFEALRFNRFTPAVFRHASREQTVDVEGKDKPRTIPAGSTVFAALGPAMFDPREFPNPLEFDPARSGAYMLFGYGYHECFGKHINAVTIPELVAAILRLPNLRRASGLIGGPGLREGPFTTHFVVLFDGRCEE